MGDVLGTRSQRIQFGLLSRRFVYSGLQEDLDKLKTGIVMFEEKTAAEKLRQAAAQQPEQPELSDGHIGTTEGDDIQTA